MLKKLGIVLGIVIALFVALAIIVPLVVDVDKYRPQIVEATNSKINGKLELGKLSLSLWGQIRVQIQGMTLTDAQNRKVLAVNDAFFHVPFTSIFSGAPLLTLKMDKPEVRVVKGKDGKLNVMTLMKETPKETPPGTTGAPPAEEKKDGNLSLPGIATRARLGVELKNALVGYRDEATQMDTQIKDLNLLVKDLSLSRATELELSANLDTKMGKTLLVRGPVKMKGRATPQFSGGQFEKAALVINADMSDLEVLAGGAFEKKKGVKAQINGVFESTAQSAKIEKLTVEFFNAVITASGQISNLAATPSVTFSMQSNTIDLKPWNELIPMLKQYELGGNAKLSAEANGPADKLNYKADFSINALTAKAPMLKAQPQFDAVINITTDKVDNLLFTMKAPANDLKIQGSVVSFTAPRANFAVTSNSLDLDQLIDLPPPGAKTAKKEEAPKEVSGGDKQVATGEGKAAAENYDAMLDPLRENKSVANTIANIALNMKLIKVYGVRITDITSKMSMKDLVAAIDQFNMNLWNGNVGMTASVNMKPKAPTYRFGSTVANLDLRQAVTSQLEMFKNTVLGKASFKMEGTGASFNPEPAKSNLNAKGNMKVVDATFASIDVGKMATEGLNKAIERVGEKLPQVKGKSIKGLPGRESKYDLISSDFSIAGGTFSAPNFVAKAAPNQGIDLSGKTNVGLKDYKLDAHWELIDTYNLTKAKDISVNVAGTEIPSILAEKGKPVRFPVDISGTAQAPVYSYTQVPEFLVKVAVQNTTGAAQGRAKQEVQKRVEDAAKNAPAPVQNAIKGFGKKLFGN